MRRIDVAIGILIKDCRVLICQRRPKGAFAGLWEFPGGKCEVNESPTACLARELREELDVSAEPSGCLPPLEHEYKDATVRLFPFVCENVQGEPRPLASQQLRWVTPLSLRDYPFPEANSGLIEQIILLLAPG